MKKSQLILNIIFASLIIVWDILYTFVFKYNLLVKSITSAIFVIMGIVNLVFAIKTRPNNLKFPIIMVVALTLAMIGDIAINLIFELGAGFFAIGHIFYFVAYCQLAKFKWKDLLYGLAIFVPVLALILFVPIFDFGGNFLKIVCIAYAAIISCMVSKSISNQIQEKSLLNLIILIGSILFCVSDLMLLFDCFTSLPAIMGILCLATYYPAQIFLAYSICEHTNAN